MIKIEENTEYKMDFVVYEVASWCCDEKQTPCEYEQYVAGVIKWDGCSHIWFGETDDSSNYSGYLHLCGKLYWDRHVEMMNKLYELASRKIAKYDVKVAGI